MKRDHPKKKAETNLMIDIVMKIANWHSDSYNKIGCIHNCEVYILINTGSHYLLLKGEVPKKCGTLIVWFVA